MHELFPGPTNDELASARKRIWNGLEPKLSTRTNESHGLVLHSLACAKDGLVTPKLKKVQAKERLLDLLPARVHSPSIFSRCRDTIFEKRVWSVATLSFFFTFLFAPLFQFSPHASAGAGNILDVISGSAVVIRDSKVFHVTDAMILHEGDRVKTEDGSFVNLQLLDDSRVTMGPNSDVLLTELYSHPGNSARTEVTIDQLDGRVWSQILNLVGSDSFFALRFKDGEVVSRQRSSFDVKVDDESVDIQVARNLVDVIAVREGEVYLGTLGQGAFMSLTSTVLTGELTDEQKNDSWWNFNLSYGKSYARNVDAKYSDAVSDVLILPGSFLYPLKALQEGMQDLVTVTEDGKQNLAMQRADNRLSEAKALIALGEDEKAEKVMNAYDKTISKIANLSQSDDLIAHLEQTQKSLFSSEDGVNTKIETHVEDVKALTSNDIQKKTESNLLTASQKLSRVPDLIEADNFDLAMSYLTAYRDKSLSTYVELESVPMEEREGLVKQMLTQKIKDLQMLRVISSMPKLSGQFDANSQILQEMNMMVLSLRERQLDHLSGFVQADRTNDTQLDLFDRLKSSVDLTPELDEQLTNLEGKVDHTDDGSVVVELTTTPVVSDPRLDVSDLSSDSHSDESENQSKNSDNGTENPESHYDL